MNYIIYYDELKKFDRQAWRKLLAYLKKKHPEQFKNSSQK